MPTALRVARTREGWSQGQLARAAAVGLVSLVEMERPGTRQVVSRPVREALLEAAELRRADQWRENRRKRARAVWQGDPRTPAREEAALLLDLASEELLADWVLRARPEWALFVCTFAAVHMIARRQNQAFGILRHVGLVDEDRYFPEGLKRTTPLDWVASPDHLIP